MSRIAGVVVALFGMLLSHAAWATPPMQNRKAVSLCDNGKGAILKYLTADKSSKDVLVGEGVGWTIDPPNNVHIWQMESTTAKAGLVGDVLVQGFTVTTPLPATAKVKMVMSAYSRKKEAVAQTTVCEVYRKATTKDWSQVKATDLIFGDVWTGDLIEMGQEKTEVAMLPGGPAPAGASASSRVFLIITDQYNNPGFRVTLTLSPAK